MALGDQNLAPLELSGCLNHVLFFTRVGPSGILDVLVLVQGKCICLGATPCTHGLTDTPLPSSVVHLLHLLGQGPDSRCIPSPAHTSP